MDTFFDEVVQWFHAKLAVSSGWCFDCKELSCWCLQEKDDSDDSDESESEDDGSKEGSTLAGTKHKSDTVLEGEAKRGSSGSAGSIPKSAPTPGANSAPTPGIVQGMVPGSNSAPIPGGVPVTLTVQQLRALQSMIHCQ